VERANGVAADEAMGEDGAEEGRAEGAADGLEEVECTSRDAQVAVGGGVLPG
jgi:hypothetical protein